MSGVGLAESGRLQTHTSQLPPKLQDDSPWRLLPKLKDDAPWQIVMTLFCGWGAVMLGVGALWAVLLRGPCRGGCVWVDAVTLYMLVTQLVLMIVIWGVVRVVLWEARLPAPKAAS